MRANTRSVLVALLLCLGMTSGWAQQDEQQESQQQPQAGQQGQQKQEQPQQKKDAQKDQQQKDRRQMRGLDEEVQDVKSDVLRISAELRQLEEKLLYPSGTQVAVFVALAKGDQMRLDSVRVQIDGQMVAQYVYSAKELEALRKGGVQRLYVGNVATGDHQLEVSMDGKRDGGEDFTQSQKLSFRKEVKPKLLELTLAGPDSGSTPIALGEL
ncbi:MAG TPA: hypothetical protein VNI57_08955 [Candidatus Saccharimonadales bacterium]|nr:hypothetical protein [Candidatus Saccharimonadales bacterium]